MWLRGGLSCGMDIEEWLGAEVRVGQRDKTLPDCVQAAVKEAWEQGILDEDDLPEDGTTLDDVQLENELKIVLKGFADGVRLLKYSRQRNSARTRRNFQGGFGPVSPINPPSCWLGRRPR